MSKTGESHVDAHGRWLHDVERRAPAVPSLRQPRPQHPICGGQTKTLTARSIAHGKLMSKDDDLQVQRRAGANEKAQRVKQRDDDRRHESRLSEDVGNLNRHNVYGVFNRHSTKGETPATAKELPTDYRASSRLYRDLVCTQNASRSNRLSKYTCRPRASAHALHAT
jgi:hypothetical protein